MSTTAEAHPTDEVSRRRALTVLTLFAAMSLLTACAEGGKWNDPAELEREEQMQEQEHENEEADANRQR